jgi:hypothetical protein
MLFIFSTPVLIRHLQQLKTVVFLHWCLICAVPLKLDESALAEKSLRRKSYLSDDGACEEPDAAVGFNEVAVDFMNLLRFALAHRPDADVTKRFFVVAEGGNNKLGCLSLERISQIVWYFWVRLGEDPWDRLTT